MKWLATLVAFLVLLVAGCGAAQGTERRALCTKSPASSAAALLAEAGLSRMQIEFSTGALRRQAAKSLSTVCFERAVMLAVASLAMEERTDTGPIETARRRSSHRVCVLDEEPDMIACYMNRPRSRFGLAGPDRPAPLGHAANSAWVFWLELPELSDATFWAAVERAPPGGLPPRVISFGTAPPRRRARAEKRKQPDR